MQEGKGVEEGSRSGQKEKLSCDVGGTTASPNSHDGARMGRVACAFTLLH